MESVALLTKEIWISTPLVLGIVVCVALRLISYKVAQLKPPDRIVHETPQTTRQIVSYMGYGERSWDKRKQGSPMYLHKYCSLIVTSIPSWGANEPPFMHKRGRQGGCGRGPALGVLFDLSGGKGGKGGGVPLCTVLHSPFAHRGGVAQPTHIGWGATSGRTGGDHMARGGGGTQTVFTLPLPSLNPRLHAMLRAGGGG